MPARPEPPTPPDETSERVRESDALLAQAIDRLKDARDLLDEAGEVESLPDGLAGALHAYESVIESLRRTLEEVRTWNDDKAELVYSRHSPLRQEGRPPPD